MKINTALTRTMRLKNLNKTQLSELSGLANISQALQTENPTINTVLKILNACNCDLIIQPRLAPKSIYQVAITNDDVEQEQMFIDKSESKVKPVRRFVEGTVTWYFLDDIADNLGVSGGVLYHKLPKNDNKKYLISTENPEPLYYLVNDIGVDEIKKLVSDDLSNILSKVGFKEVVILKK
jgi:hypothetical protein